MSKGGLHCSGPKEGDAGRREDGILAKKVAQKCKKRKKWKHVKEGILTSAFLQHHEPRENSTYDEEKEKKKDSDGPNAGKREKRRQNGLFAREESFIGEWRTLLFGEEKRSTERKRKRGRLHGKRKTSSSSSGHRSFS